MSQGKKTPSPTNKPRLDSSDSLSQTELTAAEKDKWQDLLKKISLKSHHLLTLYAEKAMKGHTQSGTTVFSPAAVMDAFMQASGKLLENPEALLREHHTLLSKHALLNQHMRETIQNKQGAAGKNPTPEAFVIPDAKDKRFQHPHWEENPFFNYLKQFYLLNSKWLEQMYGNIEGLDPKTAQKVSFYTKQMLDAVSPSNFPHTNPEVIHKTLETRGENLLQGLANFLQDLERGKGRLSIPKTNLRYFKVGENIAATKGKVIYQNDLIQLIHYTPTQKKTNAVPLLIVPPWINKFYIFDLNKNSFVKFALDNGHSVFIISWVNPDETLSHKTFADYMHQGPLEALEQTLKVTGASQANVVSYCIGGILMSCTLGYMAAHQDNRIQSATFFATLVDFEDPGELTVFIDDDQLNLLEKRMREKGYLDSHTMAESFSLLRANSLIWRSYVNNYLLSEEFAPFDMLFWNSDATRMPPDVHSYYLRNLYQKNKLVKQGELELSGTKINLKEVKIPCFFVSAIDDHIAPWHCGYGARQAYGGPVKFILAGSGHVAGIFNDPSSNKYGYWVNGEAPTSAPPAQWLETAHYTAGSWWNEWKNWIQNYQGDQIPALQVGERSPTLQDAPGSYVLVSDIY